MKLLKLLSIFIGIIILHLSISCGPSKEVEQDTPVFSNSATAPYIINSVLTTSSVTSSSVTLSWEKATKDGEDDSTIRYQAYYSTTDNISELNDVTLNGTAFDSLVEDINQITITGLSETTTYYFNVLAVNTANNAAAYEMTSEATAAYLPVPTNPAELIDFTDGDLQGNEVSGTITVTKAVDESDLTHYVIYWGSDSTTKLSGESAIAEVAKTGANVTSELAADTLLPVGATHLLVFTKNENGEMATGVSQAITDKAIPVNPAQALCFDDGQGGGNIAGSVTFTRAADESDITHYNLYWGSDATTKYDPTAIVSWPKATAGNELINLPSTDPVGATHFLLYTANADGEMLTGINLTPLNSSATGPCSEN